MCILSQLQPQSVFRFFEEICSIPHTSYHEKALSDYCVNFAKEHGFFVKQEENGNLIIIADATEGYENVEPILIQGHLDMVGEKTADCAKDLLTDGLDLYIEDDYIYADGTTLGGDDGIAIAYALALLDDDTISHPRLEVVFTVCEEVGLLGATAIDLSVCQAKKMINIDSEIEGILTVGCAGGIRSAIKIPIDYIESSGTLYTVSFDGFIGGHSGTDIHKERANANCLMGRFLSELKGKTDYSLVSVTGGSKENVIPTFAKICFVADSTSENILKEIVDDFSKKIHDEYSTADPNIMITLDSSENGIHRVFSKKTQTAVTTALLLSPNGVQHMSADLPGLVETSLNLGVVSTSDESVILRSSIRSSVAARKDYLTKKLSALADSVGATIEFMGAYPAWPYAKESALRDTCVSIFEKQYEKKPVIEMLHAGLECGIFSDKLPNLDCISFGPDLINIHTPDEHMSISSVGRVWEYLKAIVQAK